MFVFLVCESAKLAEILNYSIQKENHDELWRYLGKNSVDLKSSWFDNLYVQEADGSVKGEN